MSRTQGCGPVSQGVVSGLRFSLPRGVRVAVVVKLWGDCEVSY